jgi:hypothetical protein
VTSSAPTTTFAILAGDESGPDAARPELPHHLRHAGIGANPVIVVPEIVFAVCEDHCVELVRILGPLAELDPERRAQPGKPVRIAARGKAMCREGVVIAVENQPHGVDQRAVEIEQHGAEARGSGGVWNE